MGIRIKPYFALRHVMENHPFIEIDSDSTTIEELLENLFVRYEPELRAMIVDAETGGISPNSQILVIRRHYRTLPNKLKTLLTSGNEISLFPAIVGG
jgi:molybdopterin converting factor small subunit